MLITALQTGMRKGEIIKLRWENVDLESNIITIDKATSKSKKTKKIPINSRLRKLLLEQKLKSGNSDFVFLTPQGKPYAREDSINQLYRATLKKAGIEGLRFHDLRHTAGTRLGEMGVPVQVIQEILGHADIRTTMRYVHPGASLRDAVEKLTISEPDGHIFGHTEAAKRK
jgi:integrase